jgi:hypothetical protein
MLKWHRTQDISLQEIKAYASHHAATRTGGVPPWKPILKAYSFGADL